MKQTAMSFIQTLLSSSRKRFLSQGRPFIMASVALGAVVSQTALADGEVNVYSARKEELIKPLLDQFEESTGVHVNLITGAADALLKRLEVEGNASPADIFITVDAGRLHRAKAAGVLQPFQSEVLDTRVPDHLKDADNYWYALSQRARTIFYARDRVDPSDLSTYESLTDSQWKGRICVRSSNNIYNQSLVASMIEANGMQKTEEWVRGLVANLARPAFGGDTDLLKAAAAGVCDITLANTYYFGRLISSSNPKDNAVAAKLSVFWPNQGEGDRGVHVNVSGAGLTAAASHKENAIHLIEFLTSTEAQSWYAEVNNEYPVVADAPSSDVLNSLGTFHADSLILSKLGDNNRAAVEIMDRAGWR